VASPVTWFEIIGNDPIKLQKFYSDIFGWQLSPPVPEMGNYSMMQGNGHGIGGGIGGNMGGSNRVTVYIEVGDPQAYLDKVIQAGGKLLMPVTAVTPEVTIAMFADPEGNTIGLLKGNAS
jgi:predicted enzyme related to lactoylglutathione lyase